MPPPPAHHFQPASAAGELQATAKKGSTAQEIADAAKAKAKTDLAKTTGAKAGNSKSVPEVQSKFDQLVANSKQKSDSAAGAEITALSDGSAPLTKPIRKPYGLASTADPISKQAKSTTDSAIAASTDSAKQIAGNASNAFNPGVAKAQADFKSALASSKQAVTDSVANKSTAATNSVAGAANDFSAGLNNQFQTSSPINAAQNKVADAQAKVNATKQSINEQVASVNKSLYDRAGNLTGVSGGALKPSANKGSSNNSLQPSSKGLAAANGGANSFGQNNSQVSPQSGAELQKIQSEVALAQQQIAELKAQIAATKQPVSSSSLASQSQSSNSGTALAQAAMNVPNQALNMAAAARQSQFQPNVQASFQPTPNSPGNFSPVQSANNSAAGNALRPSGFSGSNQFGNSDFAATPHNGYMTQASNQTPIANSTLSGSNPQTVIRAETGSADRMGWQSHASSASHVSDIDIPEAVLRGSGSYAPGSTYRLMPKQ